MCKDYIYIKWQDNVCEPFGITWISAYIGHKICSDLHDNTVRLN